MIKEKDKIFFEGTYKNFSPEECDKIQNELLFFIKEKGLTISQATVILSNIIKLLPMYSIPITVADYEKLTGKDIESDD